MLLTIARKFLLDQKNKIEKVSNRKSNIKMTLMKAFGIIVVVCGHTNGGAVVFPMDNWVRPTFYFMPLFVFASGFMYKEENDNTNTLRFILNKIKSLVIPYFVWNIFYGLLNTLFRNTGVINYGDNISLYSLFVRPWIDGHQYHFNIPSWFLLSLFIDIVAVFLIRKLFKKLRIFNDWIILILTCIMSILAIYYAKQGYNYSFYLCVIKAAYMLPFFQLGYLCKKHEEIISKHRVYWISGLLLLIGAMVVFLPELKVQVVFANFTGNPVSIVVLTGACLILVSLICEILAPAFTNDKIVKFIGDNTYSIMMHHGFVIFLINLGLYWISGIIELSAFNIDKFKSTLWYCYPWRNGKVYIVYAVLGVLMPLVVKWLYNKTIILCNNRLSYKNTTPDK